MKKFLYWVVIAFLFTLMIAYFTKQDYMTAVSKISEELNKAGFYAGSYLTHDTSKPQEVKTAVVAKDRIFYWDLYFPVEGKMKKVGRAAFNKIFIVD